MTCHANWKYVLVVLSSAKTKDLYTITENNCMKGSWVCIYIPAFFVE